MLLMESYLMPRRIYAKDIIRKKGGPASLFSGPETQQILDQMRGTGNAIQQTIDAALRALQQNDLETVAMLLQNIRRLVGKGNAA